MELKRQEAGPIFPQIKEWSLQAVQEDSRGFQSNSPGSCDMELQLEHGPSA